VEDAGDVDGVGGLHEEDAVLADAKAAEACEAAFEGFNVSFTGAGEVSQRVEDLHGRIAVDGAEVGSGAGWPIDLH
jgi:hypothetical protein